MLQASTDPLQLSYADALVCGLIDREKILRQCTSSTDCVPSLRQYCHVCKRVSLIHDEGAIQLHSIRHKLEFEQLWINMRRHSMN